MAVMRPTQAQLRGLAQSAGMSFSDEDAAFFAAAMEPSLQQYDVVDAMPDNLPVVRYPRTPGYEPGPDENKHGAWYRRSVIKGA
ncbi:MAG: hypothetical protein ACREFQ_16670, partial [Stellaceae bacterium]